MAFFGIRSRSIVWIKVDVIAAGAIAVWLAVTTYEALVQAWTYTCDDAYITLRYARHLVDGHGIVWNIGEAPVEGYSNFSFLLIAAGAIRLGVDEVLAIKWMGAIGLFGALVAAYALAREWVGRSAALLPAALITAQVGALLWAVSGLETGLYLCSALATIGFTLRARRRSRYVLLAAMCALFMALTRPEGVVVALFCALALAFDERGAWARARVTHFVLAFGVPYVAYFAFRTMYFGHVLPNAVRCKMAWEANPWQLVLAFVRVAWPGALAVFAYPFRKLDVRHTLLAAIVLFHVLAFRAVDPVQGDFNRYFLLPLSLIFVLATAGVCDRLRTSARQYGVGSEVLLAIVAVIAVAPLRREAADRSQTIAIWYWFRGDVRASVGRYLKASLAKDATYVVGDAGVVGYLAPQRSIDALCLNSAEMTTLSVEAFTDWVAKRRPEAIVVPAGRNDIRSVTTYFGVFQRLLARPGFDNEYRLAGRWGNSSGAWYFVYERI